MRKITSFLVACKLLKRDPKKLPIVKHLPKLHAAATLAEYQRWTIADAIRAKWVPDYNDDNQPKYFPVFYFKPAAKRGGRPTLVFHYVDSWLSTSYVGSRLCFENYADAEYFGKKFIKLHEKVHRID